MTPEKVKEIQIMAAVYSAANPVPPVLKAKAKTTIVIRAKNGTEIIVSAERK